MLPFGDLVYCDWADRDLVPDGRALRQIAQFLRVEVDPVELAASYDVRPLRSNDLFIYLSATRAGCLMVIDYFIDPADQCSMVTIGLRCPLKDAFLLYALIHPLYFKSQPRTPLRIEWHGDTLWRLAEHAERYVVDRPVHIVPQQARAWFFSQAQRGSS